MKNEISVCIIKLHKYKIGNFFKKLNLLFWK